jgi:hypothetical protein
MNKTDTGESNHTQVIKDAPLSKRPETHRKLNVITSKGGYREVPSNGHPRRKSPQVDSSLPTLLENIFLLTTAALLVYCVVRMIAKGWV